MFVLDVSILHTRRQPRTSRPPCQPQISLFIRFAVLPWSRRGRATDPGRNRGSGKTDLELQRKGCGEMFEPAGRLRRKTSPVVRMKNDAINGMDACTNGRYDKTRNRAHQGSMIKSDRLSNYSTIAGTPLRLQLGTSRSANVRLHQWMATDQPNQRRFGKGKK